MVHKTLNYCYGVIHPLFSSEPAAMAVGMYPYEFTPIKKFQLGAKVNTRLTVNARHNMVSEVGFQLILLAERVKKHKIYERS